MEEASAPGDRPAAAVDKPLPFVSDRPSLAMRILFIHANYPSQHGPFAHAMARAGHEVFFLTARETGAIEGVTKVLYRPKRKPRPETHHYLRQYEDAILHGQAALEAMIVLQKNGFIPDIVLGHSGWGATMFARDAFPRAILATNFEWYYNSHGADLGFDPAEPLTIDNIAQSRIKNSSLLIDLVAADAGLCPTRWQQQQFPRVFQPKLEVMHEGVDTDYHQPVPGTALDLPRVGISLPADAPLITYVSRGLEPYRGFPQFIEAMYLVQRRNPRVHVVIAGEDRVAYGRALPDNKTFKTEMLERFPLDAQRTFFPGILQTDEYRKLLQASSAHVYLTRPFVLSWSMLEAMSAGCLVIGSRTAPVQEVIEDGFNGLLCDFFSPTELADKLIPALDHPAGYADLRVKARETIVHKYARKDLFPRRFAWLQQLLEKK
jgi:glycosyltransferase involved in cell wall biosynthesis